MVELPLMGVEGLPSNMSLRAIVEKVGKNVKHCALTIDCTHVFIQGGNFDSSCLSCLSTDLSTRLTVSCDPLAV